MIKVPGYIFVDLGPDGGPYDDMSNPKVCIHTTEGATLAGAESAYKNYPPHLGYDPIRRIKHQYISLDRHSYSFKGSESDDEFIVQVEVVGFAAQTHNWMDLWYYNFAEDVIKPLENLIGVPRSALRFYGQDEGIILAHKNSPIRLTPTALRHFRGWLGHQHIPSPDNHWDPGRFLIHKSFNYLPTKTIPVEKKELDMSVRLVRGDSTQINPENNLPWGYSVYMVKYDPELPGGAIRTYMEDGPVYRTLLKAQGSVDLVEQKHLDAIPKVSGSK